MSVTNVGYVSPASTPIEFYSAQRHINNAPKPEEQKAAENAAREKSRTIESTAEELQRLGSAFNKKLRFEVDSSSRQIIVKVIDKDTDKVIRELPPEELQRLHKSLKEAIGLIFDEMA